jgi:protein tyrosine phosphatase (PTP) superfamily phosphohydrolase (DUF442 family)
MSESVKVWLKTAQPEHDEARVEQIQSILTEANGCLFAYCQFVTGHFRLDFNFQLDLASSYMQDN